MLLEGADLHKFIGIQQPNLYLQASIFQYMKQNQIPMSPM